MAEQKQTHRIDHFINPENVTESSTETKYYEININPREFNATLV